jgi:rhodanese-related sulfurtransferase
MARHEQGEIVEQSGWDDPAVEETQASTISKEELQEKLKRGDDFSLVNVLKPEGYKAGLIPHSQRIPLSELAHRWSELPVDKEVVVYCANKHCNASKEAAQRLKAEGYKVRAYEGGIDEWKSAGLPWEPAPAVEAPIPAAEGNSSETALDNPSGLSGIENKG